MSSAAKRAVVAGELHKIVKRYGVVDGKNRKIYKSYAVIGGVNRLIYMSENFAFTGAYAVSLVEIDGTKYDLYKLTTSGILSIYADEALFWMCGGGAGGESSKTGSSAGHRSGNAGGGGAGAFCTSGDLPTGKYPVEIGTGGAADQDGSATILGEYTAAGGKTGHGGSGGIGGTGGGGAAFGDYSGPRNGQGGAGDQTDKYPFGLPNMGAHCAGGGGGMLRYSTSYLYITGGKGGTNGEHGNGSSSSAGNGAGGEKGGGNGGSFDQNGKDATFYGSAGGGGGVDIAISSNTFKGGSGYQGVVYIAIPHKETIEPIVIIRQPQSQAAVAGDTVTFHVEATGVASYQWQFSTDDGATWNNLTWTGYNTATMTRTMTANAIQYKYRCKLTGMDGTVVYTDVVYFAPIIITKQPEDVTAAVGETAVFSIAAQGNGLTYQWEFSHNNGTNWGNVSRDTATTAELAMTGVGDYHNGCIFRCIITDANGNTVTTDGARLTVTS